MVSSIFTMLALAGSALAFTPAGFEPASKGNLTVAYGNTLAIDGKEIQKAETANAPSIGTTQRLVGTYAIMMVDPDIPPSTGSTNELLHWIQAGLTSANKSTTINGVQVFELVSIGNESAIAPYIQPSPPDKAPNTHRYTQLILNMTGNSSALSTLTAAGKSRGNFSAANVVKSAGLTVLFGNSFNVTNGSSSALVQSNITIQANTTSTSKSGAGTTATSLKSSGTAKASSTAGGPAIEASASASATGHTNATTTAGSPKSTGGAVALGVSTNGAYLAGFGALVAAVALL